MRLRTPIAIIAALSLAMQPVVAEIEDLPDIGSPSDSVLSKEKEAQLGRAMYRSLLDTNRVILDPEIQEYIQDIGQKLAAHAQDGDFRFHFFVVDDPAINAFALPGGYIGIHSGMLLAAATESELAGVIAHEISHVTQRHISRAVFANQRVSILTMAALLGAILIGAATGSADIIQGGVMTAQTITAQQQINFTRSNEYEADRFGVRVLAAAGFDPMGMPDFFETMARRTGPLANKVPEFLQTHPVTMTRIAEARARAEQYPRTEVHHDATGFTLTQARVRVLTSSTPEKALEYFKGERRQSGHFEELGNRYGMALAKMQIGEYAAAGTIFSRLLSTHEGIIHFHTGLAAAQMAQGRVDDAFSTYEHAMELFPRNIPLTVRYSQALLDHGRAALAHEILLDLLNQVPPTAGQVRLIALAASAAGDTADAHYYMAEYHVLSGNLRMAADQLRLALSIPDLDNVQKARFLARLKQIQEWMPTPQQQRRKKRDKDH